MLWRPSPFTREGEAAASHSLFCCSRGCRNEQPSGPADPLATHQGWLRISHTALPPGSRRNDLQSTLRPSASDASLNFILGTGLPPIFSGFSCSHPIWVPIPRPPAASTVYLVQELLRVELGHLFKLRAAGHAQRDMTFSSHKAISPSGMTTSGM